MRTASDVAVVGGGPCGSFAAFNLARRGFSVNVFEEHPEVGVPSHCAGHLSIKGLRDLRLYPLPEEIVENAFRGAIFHSPNGKEFSLRFSSPVTCVVNRPLFDKHIARLAEEAGACYHLNSRVDSIIQHDFIRSVSVEGNGKTANFPTKIVVDAEGTFSRVLRQTGVSPFKRERIVNAVQAEVDDTEKTEPDMVEVFLGNEYAPGFYAWLIPKRDGKAKVGLAARKGNPRRLLENFMHKHPTASKKLKTAKILQMSFHPITLGGMIPQVFSNGLLVVGDSASQVKPTTGGGIVLGMTCARIAADVASESLEKSDFSSSCLGLYQKRCKESVGFDLGVMLKVRRFLDVMPDEKIDEGIGFLSKFGMDRVLQRVQDIDFQGQSMLRLMRRPRMLAALLYFTYLYLSTNL